MDQRLRFEMFDPHFRANPFDFYGALRETGGVHRVYFPAFSDVWLVTRYADARAVLTDPRLSKEPANVSASLREAIVAGEGEDNLPLMSSMLNSDPPDHTRLRRLVVKAFTPRRVQELRPRVQEIADELLDRVAGTGRADLIDDFAFPLPITVICELLGIPVADRDAFREWSTLLTSADEDERPLVEPAFANLHGYLSDFVGRMRREPDAGLISALVSAADGVDGLDDEEVVTMALLLLVAGHETTVNLVGNGVIALLTHPDQLAALRADESLLAPAIEEFIRYNGPVETATWRYTMEPVVVGGVEIPAGEPVLVVLASANRDPERFAGADRLDIKRGDNPHVGFGHGIHHCLGAPLARLEGQVAISTLLRRFPDLALTVSPGDLQWRPGIIMRGVRHLPVSFSAS